VSGCTLAAEKEKGKMKAQERERQEQMAALREMVKPGDTVYTILRSVSRSGMLRHLDCYIQDKEPGGGMIWITSRVAAACDFTFTEEDWRKSRGLRVGGCGTDVGFEVVYNLGYALYPGGYECGGDKCHSNDHYNQADNKNTHHKDGGYAFRQEWL
jgi:hypothetical protein